MTSHDGISPRMVGGLELLPEKWLNAELARMNQTWRVRDLQSLEAIHANVTANIGSVTAQNTAVTRSVVQNSRQP